MPVREVHIHDKFDIKASMEHDIALIKLGKKTLFNLEKSDILMAYLYFI